MGYIGNEPTTGHFPVQTNLVGAPSGSYTLDRAPASAGAIEVSVQGVLQPTTAYSVSGTTLTMAGVTTGIPIFIRYLGETLTLPTIADGVVVEGKIGAGAVTNTKIGAGAVTDAKLASSGTMPAWNGAALTGITHTPANDSVTDASIASDTTISEINLKDYGEITNAIGSIGGGTQDIDLTLGNSVTATLDTSTTTFTFSNPTAGDEGCGFTLVLSTPNNQTIVWPTSVDWKDATAPDLSGSALPAVLSFWTVDGGTIWYGFLASSANG